MPNILEPDLFAGCFRCAYVWRPRSRAPSICPRCKSRLWDVTKLETIHVGHKLGVSEVIGPKRAELRIALRNHKARNPRVFGSVRRSEATRNSDLDLLVDFDSGASIFDQVALTRDLELLFKRRVDLVAPDGLHWLVRPQVLFEAIPI